MTNVAFIAKDIHSAANILVSLEFFSKKPCLGTVILINYEKGTFVTD